MAQVQYVMRPALTPLLPSVSQKEPDNAIASALLVSSLHVTDCISDEHQSSAMPQLPLELVQLIIEFVLEDMRSTKIGVTAAALLHVSSSVRFWVAKAFAPIKLYEVDTPLIAGATKARLPEEISSYIGPAVRWHVCDFSIRRHGVLSEPHCASMDGIFFLSGALAQNAAVRITVKTDEATHTSATASNGFHKDKDIRINRVVHLVKATLESFGFGDRAREKGALLPRTLSLHQRALNGSLEEPVESVTIELRLDLKVARADPASQWHWRCWSFDTKAVRS